MICSLTTSQFVFSDYYEAFNREFSDHITIQHSHNKNGPQNYRIEGTMNEIISELTLNGTRRDNACYSQLQNEAKMVAGSVIRCVSQLLQWTSSFTMTIYHPFDSHSSPDLFITILKNVKIQRLILINTRYERARVIFLPYKC